MKDSSKMSDDEIQKELDIFSEFIQITGGIEMLNVHQLMRYEELRVEKIARADLARMDAAFAKLEEIEASYRKHFGPIPPVTERS